MATQRRETGQVIHTREHLGTRSRTDANSLRKKEGYEDGEKAVSIRKLESGPPPYGVDPDTGDDLIVGPADKDDILTHTIHVEDNPATPALTFRTWFLGEYNHKEELEADNFRYWILAFRGDYFDHLLFQTSDRHRLHCLPGCHYLHPLSIDGLRYSKKRRDWQIPKPTRVHCQRALGHYHHG